MRIALYGNVCNNMFAIAKALRTHSSHDAHLYLPEKSVFNTLPENDEPELRDNYPFWIHRSSVYNLASTLYFWRNNLIKELNKYDLVILSSLSIALSPFLRKCRVLFFATGGDLTVLPFKEIHRTLFYHNKKIYFKPWFYQWLQRGGIKNSSKILTQPFFPFANALKKLNIPDSKIIDSYFPIIIDTDKFIHRANAYKDLKEPTRKQLGKFSFKIFHPSRIVINNHLHYIETGQCKRNDILLKAFAEFIKNNNVKDAGLYLIELHHGLGKEVAEFKKLIKKLKIEEFVVWLKPENSNGFTRNELVNIYSCSNLVADDFCAGWFGSICVEGFSCSKPVLSYVDQDAMKKVYKWHPFLSSNTIEGNAAFIAKCYFDKDFLKIQGENGRRWAMEYHSPENAGKLYAREFERLLTLCR